MSLIRKTIRSISLPVLIGSAGMAAIALYEGEGIWAALLVFAAWYVFIQLIIWLISKARLLFAKQP